MTLSLDTSVCIELLRRKNAKVRAAFSKARSADQSLVTSLIVSHELYFGAELGTRQEDERAAIRDLLALVPPTPYDLRDIAVVTHLRAHLRRSGRAIGAYDLLIAGQALARGWTVVTGNVREFARVPDLAVIDWTAPTGA